MAVHFIAPHELPVPLPLRRRYFFSKSFLTEGSWKTNSISGMPLSLELAWIAPDTSDETIFNTFSPNSGRNAGMTRGRQTDDEEREGLEARQNYLA